MKPTIHAVITTAAVALLLTGATSAEAGAIHEDLPESYDSTEPFEAGEGPCVPWAGTFHEVRSGAYRLVVPPGDPDARGTRVNGVIHGLVELVPVDPTLPTYSGTYREKVNAVILGVSPEGEDLVRVAQYRLRLPLAGTDGSRVLLTLAGKVTVNAKGVATVQRDSFSCA